MKFNKLKKLGASLLLSSAIALAPIAGVFAQTSHTVQEGEWLWGIARQYGLTADDIMVANGLSSEWINPGMYLYIPASGYVSDGSYDNGYTESVSGVHIVRAGDTLSGIAGIYGISVNQLMAWNGLYSSWLNVGDQLVLYGDSNASYVPPTYYEPTYPSSGQYYTIQPGDTLSGIAAAYGTTVEHLMALNGLSSSWLVAGNKLCVPANGPVYTPDPSWTTPSATDGVHIVQSGDTLSGIAWTYGVTVDDLWAWNNLYTDWLNVGDVIYVGATQSTTPTYDDTSYVVETVDTSQTEQTSQTEIETETEVDDLEMELIVTPSDQEGQEILVSDLPLAARPDIHRVQEGETLDSIAVQYNRTTENLRRWNGLAAEVEVEVGQELFVSNPLLIPTLHTVIEGDTIESVASEYDTLPELITEWNELEDNQELVVDELMVVSDPRPETHDVIAGETLVDVAAIYNITVDEIRQWNNIPENVLIVNGTVIVSDPTGKATESNADDALSEEDLSDSESEESAN